MPAFIRIKREVDDDTGYSRHEYRDEIISIGTDAIIPLLKLLRSEKRNYKRSIAYLLGKLGWAPDNDSDAMYFHASLGKYDLVLSTFGYKSAQTLMEFLPHTAQHIQHILESDADKIPTEILSEIIKLDKLVIQYVERCTDMHGTEYGYKNIDSKQMKQLATKELEKRRIMQGIST